MFKKIRKIEERIKDMILILSGLAMVGNWMWVCLYFIDFGATSMLESIIISAVSLTIVFIFFMSRGGMMSSLMMEMLVILSVSFALVIWIDGFIYLLDDGVTQVLGRIITSALMMTAVSIYIVKKEK